MYIKHFKYISIGFFVSILLCVSSYAASMDTEAIGAAKCKGHGTVGFSGDGALSISGDGTLVVNEDAEVTIVYEETDLDNSENLEQECLPTEEGFCIFIGVKGKAQISGENLEVTFSGANIGLNATGDAEMVLQGYGIYIYGKDVGRWLPEGKTLYLQD